MAPSQAGAKPKAIIRRRRSSRWSVVNESPTAIHTGLHLRGSGDASKRCVRMLCQGARGELTASLGSAWRQPSKGSHGLSPHRSHAAPANDDGARGRAGQHLLQCLSASISTKEKMCRIVSRSSIANAHAVLHGEDCPRNSKRRMMSMRSPHRCAKRAAAHDVAFGPMMSQSDSSSPVARRTGYAAKLE